MTSDRDQLSGRKVGDEYRTYTGGRPLAGRLMGLGAIVAGCATLFLAWNGLGGSGTGSSGPVASAITVASAPASGPEARTADTAAPTASMSTQATPTQSMPTQATPAHPAAAVQIPPAPQQPESRPTEIAQAGAGTGSHVAASGIAAPGMTASGTTTSGMTTSGMTASGMTTPGTNATGTMSPGTTTPAMPVQPPRTSQPSVYAPPPAVQTAAALPRIETPNGHVVTGMSVAANEVIVPRGRYNAFVVSASINGAKIPMIFDTGATVTAIKYEDAAKMGIDVDRLNFSVQTRTANGVARAAPVMLPSVTVQGSGTGTITVHGVQAMVGQPGALSDNLLGHTFMTSLGGYRVEGDNLIIKAR